MRGMAIIIDQITDHDGSNIGDNTVPPGITGSLWCHVVSTSSLLELEAFLTDNLLTIGQSSTNIRMPILGSNVTYAGLDPDQRDAAIAVGASPQRRQFVIANVFDHQDPPGTYEP